MPPLFDALKKAATGRKSAAVLGDELEALRATEAELLLRYDAAALAAADGEGSQADADKAHAELTRQRALIERHANLLAAIERREARTAAEQAAAAIDAAWADTLAKSKAREAKAARVQALVRELSDAFVELNVATREVHPALPTGYPSHAAAGFALEADLSTNLVKIEFSRHFLPGGPQLLGGQPQKLDERYRHATATIAVAREQSREAAARA